MIINHVITSIDKSIGGPARSVTQLIKGLLDENKNIIIKLSTLKSPQPIIRDFKEENASINFYNSFQLKKSLLDYEIELFHGNGLWQQPVHQMAKVARKRKIPYIISPRGMLDVWSLNHKWFKKKVARILFQDKDLKHATVLHATSNSEARNIRKLGFKNPIAVIPNGIQLVPIQEYEKSKEKKKILFLSRLIKNKGIEELLQVWSMLDKDLRSNWELIIVGDGDPNYVKKLKSLKKELILKDVFFQGPVYGPEKQDYFKEANLFVLPSYTENFGIAIAEALAYQVPVITTNGAPWEDLQTYNCGWWIDMGVQPLKVALETAMQTSESELVEMGQSGRRLIEEKYSIESTAKQMLELYSWILDKREKPNFVHLV